jgi:hypothetical protein
MQFTEASVKTTVAERKRFLLRIDREVLDDVQRWANDDLRSLNGQIDYLLRRALREAGRLKDRDGANAGEPSRDA